jgi:hypothetical protein
MPTAETVMPAPFDRAGEIHNDPSTRGGPVLIMA